VHLFQIASVISPASCVMIDTLGHWCTPGGKAEPLVAGYRRAMRPGNNQQAAIFGRGGRKVYFEEWDGPLISRHSLGQ